jgi:hypothetical protein
MNRISQPFITTPEAIGAIPTSEKGAAGGVAALNSDGDLAQTNLSVYSPIPEWYQVVDGGTDPDSLLYNHDFSLKRYGTTWFLGWNANTSRNEGDAWQKNYVRMAADWDQLRSADSLAVFQSETYSTNPTATNCVEWHPSFIELDRTLFCAWFSTGQAAGQARAIGYLSEYDSGTGLWTNRKIQLLAGGAVAFSEDVLSTEANDQINLSGTNYVAIPLHPLVVGANGRKILPLILNSQAATGIGSANRVAVMWSDDEGATWEWNGAAIPFAAASYRNGQWEPFMTYDGTTYRMWFRNFAIPSVGKGYSYTESTDLLTWSSAVDSALDVMPMRGTVQADDGAWYLALADRPLARSDWQSTSRRPVSLWRSRNAKDWQGLAALFPTMLNTRYCWLEADGGYIYAVASCAGGGAISRVPIPPRQRTIGTRYGIDVIGLKNPAIRDGAYRFHGFDFLRVPAPTMTHGDSWSIAGLVRTNQREAGVALDVMRPSTEISTWGNGLLFTLDGCWRPQFTGFTAAGSATTADNYAIKGAPTVSEGVLNFVAMSFDETDRKLRLCRKTEYTPWEAKEWTVFAVRFVSALSDGDTLSINGTTYTARTSPTLATEFAINAAGATQLENIRAAVLLNDSAVRSPSRNAMQSITDGVQRHHIWFFFEGTPGTNSVDGTKLRSTGNVFDVLKGTLTINGVNNNADARNTSNQAGGEIYRLGVGPVRLTADDAKALCNALSDTTGWKDESTASTVAWSDLDLDLNPKAHPMSFGGTALNVSAGHLPVFGDVITLPGDASASVEVPGSGAWTMRFSAWWQATAVSAEFDLTVVGDKFHHARLVVRRESSGAYRLYLRRGLLFNGLASTDVMTSWVAHGLAADAPVTLAISSGLTGLSAGTYYVRDVTSTSLKLAATAGGAAVDISADGWGTLTTSTDLGAMDAEKWTDFLFSYNASRGLSITTPISATLATDVAPLAQLGRYVNEVVVSLTENRAPSIITRVKDLRIY